MRWLLLVWLLLLLTGCSGVPGPARADLDAARQSQNVSQLLGRTSGWFLLFVADAGGQVVATLQRQGGEFAWHGEEGKMTASDVAAAILKRLDGKPGKLLFNYLGQPSRGAFTVEVDAGGKVTRVEDYRLSD